MLMYDVGVQDIEMILKRRLEENQVFTEFTQQVPVRVLLRLMEILDESSGEEMMNEQRHVEPLEDGLISLVSKAKGKINPVQEVMDGMEMQYDNGEVTKEQEKLMAKNDDAEVRVGEWNARVCNGLDIEYCPTVHDAALDRLRGLMLLRYRSYRSGVIGSFRRYMETEYGMGWLGNMRKVRKQRRGASKNIVLDYEVGMDAIRRALSATFWEWDDGSTIIFWRWPKEFRRELRDGLLVWYRERDLPSYWGRQRWPEDRHQRKQLEEKVLKVVARRYIVPGYVKSLTSFFAVPKGTDDIRVVYDATKSGLNAAIWTPNFMLPTASSILNNASERTFFGDIDLGEMFLNYFLDKRLRPLAGVELGVSLETSDTDEKGASQSQRIMRWERSLMGVKSSPFNCVRAYLWSEDIIKGDHLDEANLFRWDRVIMNLPGTVNYDPGKPWLYKFDELNKKMAAFIISYVDDLRTGDDGGKERCDKVTHLVASRLNYLGEQDAARKRGDASQQPGA
jgi:hypothetical protein